MTTLLPLDGLTVVVTGEVPGLDRKQAQAAVEALGGTPSTSMSGKTNLVVAGEGAGDSKMAKVRQFGILVCPADRFAAVAADPASWDGKPLGEPLVEESLAGEEAQVPFRRSDHEVTQATAPSPSGKGSEVRLWCRCGRKWIGGGPHDRGMGCPDDPAGYPHPSWKGPPPFTGIPNYPWPEVVMDGIRSGRYRQSAGAPQAVQPPVPVEDWS